MAGPVTIIRKASPADARIVAELAAELWPEHTVEEFEQEMESLLADPECAVFLASAEDRPVALAQCQERNPAPWGIWKEYSFRTHSVIRESPEGCCTAVKNGPGPWDAANLPATVN